MVNGEPTLRGPDRWRPGTDLHFIPVILHRPHDEPGFAPKDQIRRVGNPDRPGRDFRVGTVEPRVQSIELLRKDYDVAIVSLGDERYLLYVPEIRRLG